MTRPSIPFLRRPVLTALAGVVLALNFAPALAAAQPARKAFDIPAGPATDTLKTFSAQSGEQLLYAAATVEAVRTAPLKGEFTAREALETMVRDTPLTVVADRTNGALSLVRAPAPNAPRAAVAPSPTRPASNPANNSAAEDALILSPFVVNTAKDTGYQAGSTLAGTRLRSELRDVATSITVVTQEFLRDTGATDTQGFLPYIAGAEVSGLAGNFQGGAGVDAPRATTRLRGLAAATESRNFFGTGIPLDSYNVERIEVNRGANSILFGTGSPAGIINNTLAAPKMRDAYAVELRADNNESLRATFDLDQQLIKGQLALRVLGLEDRQRFEQDFAFSNDRRLFAAATYDPKWARTRNGVLSGTVFRANAEFGKIDNRNPRTQPPTDSVTGWFNPYFGGYPVKFAWDAGSLRTTTVINGSIFFNVSPAAQTTSNLARNLNVWFDTPTSGRPGTGSSAGGTPIVIRQGVISNLPTTVGPIGNAYFGRSPDVAFAAARTPGLADPGFWSNPSMTDTSILDFRNALPEGPNRSSYYDFDTFNVSLEQRFLRDRAGFEIVLDKQHTDSGGSQLAATEIRIDNNTTLLDGTPNPNFGRPSLGGPWTQNRATGDGRTARATAFFKFDFAEALPSSRLAPWLGKHAFTALREEGRTRSKNLSGDRFSSDTDYIYGNSTQITDLNGGRLVQYSYLGPSLASRSSASGAAIPPLTAMQLPGTANGGLAQVRGQLATSTFLTTPLRVLEDDQEFSRFATSASRGGQDWVSKAAVLQSTLLHGAVVTTFGWRRDDYETRNGVNPPRGPRNNLLVDDANFPFASAVGASGRESIAKGGVVHVPARWLRWQPLVTGISGRYNQSENFAPGGARFDPNGRRLDMVTGTTKDYGFLLELADRRVVLSATWYETAQSGNNAAGIANLTQTGILQNVYQRWQQTTNQGLNPAASQLTPPPREFLDLYSWNAATASFNARPDVVLTQDFVAKGLELEMHANLTRQWRTVFSAARQEASRSNTGGAFRELFFERKINGQTLYENWTGPAGRANFINESRITVADQTLTSIVNPYNNQALQDGGPVAELRKWRWSVVSNYDFARDSRLRGVGFGGGAIWQDKIAIGFPVITSPGGARISDVKNPYFGPRELTINAWLSYKRRILSERVGLTVRLGVYNVLNDDALVPVTTQPTGQIATYRIPESRRWQLTTRFEF